MDPGGSPRKGGESPCGEANPRCCGWWGGVCVWKGRLVSMKVSAELRPLSHASEEGSQTDVSRVGHCAGFVWRGGTQLSREPGFWRYGQCTPALGSGDRRAALRTELGLGPLGPAGRPWKPLCGCGQVQPGPLRPTGDPRSDRTLDGQADLGHAPSPCCEITTWAEIESQAFDQLSHAGTPLLHTF